MSTLKSENKRSIYITLRESEQVIQPLMKDRISDEYNINYIVNKLYLYAIGLNDAIQPI